MSLEVNALDLTQITVIGLSLVALVFFCWRAFGTRSKA